MSKSTLRTIGLLTAATFYSFFVFGFTDNLKGVTLPPLLSDLHLNYSLGGTILFGAYIGFILSSLFAGILADRFGNKTVILLAGVLLVVGVLGYSSFYAMGWLTAAMLVIGMGLGAIELGSNAIIVDIHSKDKGRFLNLMAVFHGFGSMLAPLFAGWLLISGGSWRMVYRWDLVFIGLMLVIFILLPYPRANKENSDRFDIRHLGKTAFARPMGWFYFAIAVYVSVELGIASWLVTYLQEVRRQSVGTSALYLSIFFGLVMLGRFLGSFFVERVGYLRSILIATMGAGMCMALGVFGSESLAFFLPLAGFFLSIIFPTLTAAVSDIHPENTATMLGLLFTFAGVGGMFGPWLIGFASDALGIRLGFGVNLIYCILLIIAILILMKETNHDRQSA